MPTITRRGLVLSLSLGPTIAWPTAAWSTSCNLPFLPVTAPTRDVRARFLRTDIARITQSFPEPEHRNNGEEGLNQEFPSYPTYPFQASYTKALAKDGRSETDLRGADVSPAVYRDYVNILNGALQRLPVDFCDITLGGVRKQTNPQGGIALDLEGFDPHSVNLHLLFRARSPNGLSSLRPAPRIDGRDLQGAALADRENAAEMIELYWMALMRDVRFAAYRTGGALPTNPPPPQGFPVGRMLANEAAADLNRAEVKDAFDETTPYPTVEGAITRATLYRGSAPGDAEGPYISQFLLRGNTLRAGPQRRVVQRPADGVVLHGTQVMNQRQRTVSPYIDYLIDVPQFRRVQAGTEDPSGLDDYETRTVGGQLQAGEPRFIRNLRDLATWVHLDYLYQHFLNAALILLNEPPLGPDPAPPSLTAFFGQRPLDTLDFRPRTLQQRQEPRTPPPQQQSPVQDQQPPGPQQPAPPPGPLPFEEALDAPGPPFPPDPGNPYGRPSPENFNSCDGDEQIGFVSFGPPHVLTLLAEVTTRALKPAWFQKWFVHRRARPEEFGGLIHFQKMAERAGTPRVDGPYPCLDPLVLDAGVLDLIFARNRHILRNDRGEPIELDQNGQPRVRNSYFLPQVFPEGSPTHPAYPSGHATVAGACATVLKAWFDEDAFMTDANSEVGAGYDPRRLPPAFEASPDGLSLVKSAEQGIQRSDETSVPGLTVGGELNKLASNVAIGRNGAGVHWRSDATEGLKLGEAVAAGLLFEQAFTFNEEHSLSFVTFFTKERVTIGRRRASGRDEVFVRIVPVDVSKRVPTTTGSGVEQTYAVP